MNQDEDKPTVFLRTKRVWVSARASSGLSIPPLACRADEVGHVGRLLPHQLHVVVCHPRSVPHREQALDRTVITGVGRVGIEPTTEGL